MMSITSDANYGFTITYKNYYKVIENLLANKTYCVVCCGQPKPDECPSNGTFSNITSVGIDKGAYGVVPFLELIGVDNKIVEGIISLSASPCLESKRNPQPDITFTTQENITSGTLVSFSAQRNDLTPLQKAAWLQYVGAFFEQEQELLAATMFNYIYTFYNCHKDNLGYQSTQKTVAWTSYDSQQNAFTIYRDNFFNELVKDAGGRLVAANSAQDNVYLMNNTAHVFNFLMALKGVEYILDMSSTSLTYDNWITPINATIHVTVAGLPPAIVNNNIYSVNGLVQGDVSDWTQRAAARPDMALLDLIHLLYPTMEMPSNNYPVWITRFSNTNGTEYEHKMDASKYGTCEERFKQNR
ncbi:hypothetical protein RMATCC62417_18650 [Rhizopus microsporus]|nr:hypothetical protein RMATCC62417_18650 [Rhizopus microsporus]